MNKVLVLLSILVVGCATTGIESMRMSSLRLEDRTSEFYTQIRYTGDNSRRDRVSRDALALSEAARDLNLAVTHGAPREKVDVQFDRVSTNYSRLHEDLADAGYADQNRRVLEDFDKVTAAYRVVENSFTGRNARADARLR